MTRVATLRKWRSKDWSALLFNILHPIFMTFCSVRFELDRFGGAWFGSVGHSYDSPGWNSKAWCDTFDTVKDEWIDVDIPFATLRLAREIHFLL